MGERAFFLSGQIGRLDPRGQQGAQIFWVELDSDRAQNGAHSAVVFDEIQTVGGNSRITYGRRVLKGEGVLCVNEAMFGEITKIGPQVRMTTVRQGVDTHPFGVGVTQRAQDFKLKRSVEFHGRNRNTIAANEARERVLNEGLA